MLATTTIRPPTSAAPPLGASTPRRSATPATPMPTPARLRRPARSSPESANASRKVKIGAVATRMPVSDEGRCRSPTLISVNGATICTSASRTIGPAWARIPRRWPPESASGNSTSAARPVRTKTIGRGPMPSSRATLMNR